MSTTSQSNRTTQPEGGGEGCPRPRQGLRCLGLAKLREIERLVLAGWSSTRIFNHLGLGSVSTADTFCRWLTRFRKRRGLPAGWRGRTPERSRLEAIAEHTVAGWCEFMLAADIDTLIVTLAGMRGVTLPSDARGGPKA